MTTSQPLRYLPAMFATCMLFQVLYVLCIALWVVFPSLRGHSLLTDIFPTFELLDFGNFLYGLIASAIYGWFVAVTFVYFFNLWPTLSGVLLGIKKAP